MGRLADTDAETPRIGVIGRSFRHESRVERDDRTRGHLVAACDLREEPRAPVEGMGAKFYTDYRRMLDAENSTVWSWPSPTICTRPSRSSAWSEGCRSWWKNPSRAHWTTPTR